MRPPRFLAPHAHETGTTIELPEDEAAHLTRVLRLGAGAEVRVFDGKGREWRAGVEHANKNTVTVSLHEAVTPLPEPGCAIVLALGVLKGDKMDDVVRDAVMLGVTAIQPLVTTRTEIAESTLARSGRIARWQRVAVSSAKQCGRAVVPVVHAARDFESMADTPGSAIMLAEPGTDGRVHRLNDLPSMPTATLLVGPEGGWTREEADRAVRGGAMLITLGGLTLRADSVPLVALTALRVHWGDL